MGKHARERRLIAYHEAGHVVVARKLGVEIADIDMTGTDEGRSKTVTRSAVGAVLQAGGDRVALAHAIRSDLAIAFAGDVAQRLAGYSATSHDGDNRNAAEFIALLARFETGLPIQLGPNEPVAFKSGDPLHTAISTIVDRVREETAALLQDNWQAVVRVAGALAKHDRLSQVELDHVIAHGQREWQR